MNMQNKNVLLIGGTASISQEIIQTLEKNNFKIHTLTYRQKQKIYGNYNWKSLNLENSDSVDSFIKEIKNEKFNKIILVSASSASHLDILATTRSSLNFFYGNFFSNYIFLIKELFLNLDEDGQMIYISSVAANRPVPDVNYSTLKGSIQVFIQSLSTKSKGGQAIFSIAPGLIYDTPAFYDNLKNNNIKKINNLATKEQISQIILNANKNQNGLTISIGS